MIKVNNHLNKMLCDVVLIVFVFNCIDNCK